MWKRLFKMKRYFIVTYNGKTTGHLSCIIHNGEYIKADEFYKEVRKKYGIEDVFISDIHEVSKRDYNNFNK